MEIFGKVIKPLRKKPALVILTGAGISAESGIATFRDSGGLWENHRVEDVATPEGFMRNPALVQAFYNERRRKAAAARPNAAHEALFALEKAWRGSFLLVTQNVDTLQEQAGSRRMLHMHGSLESALCTACGSHAPWQGDITAHSCCPHCHEVGQLRPDIVWFGEMPYHMDKIEKALSRADYFAAIGTSGQVYPAAGFVALAHAAGARTFEINLECGASPLFDTYLEGPATHTVPEFMHQMLDLCA